MTLCSLIYWHELQFLFWSFLNAWHSAWHASTQMLKFHWNIEFHINRPKWKKRKVKRFYPQLIRRMVRHLVIKHCFSISETTNHIRTLITNINGRVFFLSKKSSVPFTINSAIWALSPVYSESSSTRTSFNNRATLANHNRVFPSMHVNHWTLNDSSPFWPWTDFQE